MSSQTSSAHQSAATYALTNHLFSKQQQPFFAGAEAGTLPAPGSFRQLRGAPVVVLVPQHPYYAFPDATEP
eukprot:130992-Chlamydomonas_euryale.AAC.8